MKTKIVLTVFILLALTGSTLAMPMHILTPEQQAGILMQPVKNEVTCLKGELVNGVITFEEWKAEMGAIKFRLEIQTTLLKAIAASDKAFEDKIEMLLAIFPWNVRSAGNMPRIIGGAHL